MKIGGKRQLIIPPALGYGSRANGSIPANSILVFTIDLVSVQ
jgi:peptidylprolyl isomerase